MRMRCLTWVVIVLCPIWGNGAVVTETGGLYPRDTPTRDVASLDGAWDFRLSPASDPEQGYEQKWYTKQLKKTGAVESMYVPSSYNDVGTDVGTRDYSGIAWYDKLFYVSADWKGQRVWLRFGGVNYQADVWVNGQLVIQHEFGQLPFQAEITNYVQFGGRNLVTVAVSNVLSKNSIPQGGVTTVNTDDGKLSVPSYSFDFFHYAGIDRPVHLYTTPSIYIDDITVTTGINGTTGTVEYSVTFSSQKESLVEASPTVSVVLYDREEKEVAKATGSKGVLEVAEANLWWPRLMSADPGYLYHLQATVAVNSTISDTYTLSVGIRTLTWNDKEVLINSKPLYLRGFGRHEDSDFRGRGFDYPVATRDHLLLDWIGSNGYRTTHYPHAEEIMNICDKMGFLVIDEVPFTNVASWNSNLLAQHKSYLSEMIARDKNRPSVAMWSIGNDLDTTANGTEDYIKSVVQYVKSLDTSRPVTLAINEQVKNDKAAQMLDVIGLNMYYGWDSTYGRLDGITRNVVNMVTSFHTKHKKPVLVTEYGADVIVGVHNVPEAMWSEDYQTILLSQHFKAFDTLRNNGFLVGEMTPFSDYKTKQERTRVDGSKKGMFTRQRQPKQAAHLLRQRYYALANILNNATLPTDLNPYIVSNPDL